VPGVQWNLHSGDALRPRRSVSRKEVRMGKFQINNQLKKVKLLFWFAIYCIRFFKEMLYTALHVVQYITKFLKHGRNKGTAILTGELEIFPPLNRGVLSVLFSDHSDIMNFLR